VEADIVVRNPRGENVLIVEVKNRPHLTDRVATALQEPFLRLLTPNVFFMLVSQDLGYIWRADDASKIPEPPIARFSMQPIIARYWPRGVEQGRLRENELEMVVQQWLRDASTGAPEVPEEADQALERTGLSAAIRRASLVNNVRL
jgi:hypothetical protein